eukprot:1157357-Pelagomonas_calceolata.AAC.3
MGQEGNWTHAFSRLQDGKEDPSAHKNSRLLHQGWRVGKKVVEESDSRKVGASFGGGQASKCALSVLGSLPLHPFGCINTASRLSKVRAQNLACC